MVFNATFKLSTILLLYRGSYLIYLGIHYNTCILNSSVKNYQRDSKTYIRSFPYTYIMVMFVLDTNIIKRKSFSSMYLILYLVMLLKFIFNFINVWMDIIYIFIVSTIWGNRLGGLMIGVLASNVVDHGFEPRSGQTRD